ncbi:hypothetical protein E3Q19_01730 [Wallemia mellicola]|nr:hypothetical protein E3Q19_01730 [Wallemia mellicola]
MKATLETLPTELLSKIIVSYGAHELLPKTQKRVEGHNQDHRNVRAYLNFISNMNPGSLYTNSIEEYHLNLNHFHDNIRLHECANLADFISYFPNLKKLVLTLKQLREPERVHTTIGSSISCLDLTINIGYIDDHSTNELATAILQQYPNLNTLRLHRPDLVSSPGLDLDRQKRFISAFNKHIENNPGANLCKPTAILFKNYRGSPSFSRFERYETITNVNYIHIYKWNRKTGYTEATKSKSNALRKYYPETAGNQIGHPRRRRFSNDPLRRLEIEMLSISTQRLAYRDKNIAAELRTLIVQREDENAYYRNFCVETELYKLLDQLGNVPDHD